MRVVLGACGRRRNSFLRHAGRRPRRQVGDDARRAAGAVRPSTRPCPAAAPAPAAAGHDRRAGAAMRLLLQRHGHQGLGTAEQSGAAERRRDSPGDEWPFVPLRQLSAGHEGDPAGLPDDGGGTQMTSQATTPLSRRDLLKGGALIVGFNFAGPLTTPLLNSAAAPAVAATPDPAMIDSWIAVHGDNSATVFLGKCELGQGATTGLLQIAGEELDLDISQLKTVRLDTDLSPNQGATTSSSSIHRGGPQVRAAAADARQALPLRASARP